MRRLWWGGVGIALLLLAGACGASPALDHTGSPLNEARLERGVAVYTTNSCGNCHTLSAADTQGNLAPDNDTIHRDAAGYLESAAYLGSATTVEDYIRESIENPTVFLTPGYETGQMMPPYANLSAPDMDALVYLLMNPR